MEEIEQVLAASMALSGQIEQVLAEIEQVLAEVDELTGYSPKTKGLTNE